MIKNQDVEKYFSQNSEKKTFTQLSTNRQTKKPLVVNDLQAYDYEHCMLGYFKSNPLKVVDAAYIKGKHLYLIEFKSGFIKHINYDNFDITKWTCKFSEGEICEDGAQIFKKNQVLEISQLIDSIKGKLLETHAFFNGIILPQCSECTKEYVVHYSAVIDGQKDPIGTIEDGLNELGGQPPKKENPTSRLKQSLTKYTVRNANDEPLFFDYIDVWNTFEFNEKFK